MFRLGLKAKLFLVTLSIAAIPLVGIGYVREMETLLVAQQEQNLLAAARAIATALNDRPALLRLKPEDPVLKREKEDAIRAMLGTDVAAGVASTGAQTVATAGPQTQAPPQTVAQVIATEDTALATMARPVSEEVEPIVASLNRAKSRIWVIDKRFQLLALSGTLKSPDARYPETVGASGSTNNESRKPLEDNGAGAVTWWEKAELLLRPLYERLLTRPTENFDDSLPEDAIVSGSEVSKALAGNGATRWRTTPDNRARVLSAAHPVWAGNDVVAVVVVEETGNAIASFTSRAMEKLITATLAVFILVAGVVLLFATRLTQRVRRLRDEAESAVDAQGRVRALSAGSTAGDEIGDLSRSFSQLLERLAQYHDYLENLGARITHEFRTPVTVVRSSLDNLAMQPLPPEAREYMQRADEGLKRLNNLITRMGEARRLEQALRDGERSVYNVREVVQGCVEGYRAVYPAVTFETRVTDAVPNDALRVDGSPELLAQALDKLIANAVSFAAAQTPVIVSLAASGDRVRLAVENTGPLLPPGPSARLFDSMVSERGAGAASGEPHLGLGLYVARLAAEFHRGTVAARNRADTTGVVIEIDLPPAA